MKRIIVILISLLIAANVGARRRPSSRKTFALHSPVKQKRYKRAYLSKCCKIKTLKNRLKKLKKKMQGISRYDKQLEIEQQQSVNVVEQCYEPPVLEKRAVPERDNPEKEKIENEIDFLPFSAQESESQIQDIVLNSQQQPLQLVEQQASTVQQPSQPMQPVQYQPSLQSYQMPQPQMPMPMYHQPQQAPTMMPQQQAAVMQPMYQQNQNQLAATAMQLQASAMAMQAQASALMMQAQQSQQPTYSYGPVMQPSTRELTKQEKFNQCMHCLQQVVSSGDDAVLRVLHLIDLEFDILEHLLAGNTGQVVDRAVQERNATIKNSLSPIIEAYDKVLDLATIYGTDDTGARLYHYWVRKSKRAKQATTSQGKKKFLMRVMYELEKYYAMIEKMQRDLAR